MTRFSSHLLKRKLLTQEQLEEALQHQAVYGARLGTNLVELRMLTIEQLAECLAEFHRVPLPPRPWLERPKRAAVQRVTRPLVERIRFIPMRLENNVLHAAVLDPNDPRTLDDLRFATSCKIQPYVLPEIWMHDWLLMLFKVPRGIRHVETDTEPKRELENPAQNFDFQAAQAALAAKAARIMQPATIGVVGPDSKPDIPSQRKTLQGGEVRVSFEQGRVSVTGDPRTILGERTTPGTLPGPLQARGDRMSSPGEPPLSSLGALRPTMQGAPAQPTEGRPTSQGEPRPAGVPSLGALRPTAQGADARMSVPGEARPTMQGTVRANLFTPGATPQDARNTAPEIPVPFEARPNAPADPRRPPPPPSEARPLHQRTTVHGTTPGKLSELKQRHAEPPPPPPAPPAQPTAADAPNTPGSSVRPPPFAMNSWAELGARTSQVHAPVYPTPSNSMPAPELPAWEAETARIGAPLPPRPLTLEPGAPPPPPPAAAIAPPPKPLAELEAALLKVNDREQLLDVSFEIASRFARVVALFIVHRGMVQGVRCLEDGVTRSIQGVLLPLESSSMLTQAIAGGLPFRTDPRDRPIDARLRQLISERTMTEVSLFPVSLKTRVVNLLYTSNGVEPIGAISFGALSLLADQMGAAYGQLILQRKGSTP